MKSKSEANRANPIFQAGLVAYLAQGDFDGWITMGELKQHGDFGMGTFHAIDGELVLLDGVAYQALHDGTIRIPEDTIMLPFATVSFFPESDPVGTIQVTSQDDLKNQLSAYMEKQGISRFCLVRIDGTGSVVSVRSERPQTKPYRPLNICMAEDQTEFSQENATGTIVGLCCPPDVAGKNVPGWHFHFISDDRTFGGHMFSLSRFTGTLRIEAADQLEIKVALHMSDSSDLATEELAEAMRNLEQGKVR